MIRLGDDADNVRYDPSAKRVYVGFGSGALAAIDPAAAKVLAEARLPGHPESFQLERGGPRVFVNVPDAEQIAVVDRTSMKVTATWPVTAAAANYPMALDEANHRLFVGCRRPAQALVFDTNTGRQTGAFDIAGDTDDMFYDGVRRRLYIHRRRRLPGRGRASGAGQVRPDGAAGALVPALVQSAAQSPSVIFVCEHGAAKSVIATAYFNKFAADLCDRLHAADRSREVGQGRRLGRRAG